MAALLELMLDLFLLSAISRRMFFCLVLAFIILGGVAVLSNMMEPRGF